jgi:hypothetical protein
MTSTFLQSMAYKSKLHSRAGLLKNFEKGDVSNMIYGIDRWFEEG